MGQTRSHAPRRVACLHVTRLNVSLTKITKNSIQFNNQLSKRAHDNITPPRPGEILSDKMLKHLARARVSVYMGNVSRQFQ